MQSTNFWHYPATTSSTSLSCSGTYGVSLRDEISNFQGFNVLNNLDDLVIWGQMRALTAAAREAVMQDLFNLGFLIKAGKSQRIPVQNMTWLGVNYMLSSKQVAPQCRYFGLTTSGFELILEKEVGIIDKSSGHCCSNFH